jgi:hypothetical protein
MPTSILYCNKITASIESQHVIILMLCMCDDEDYLHVQQNFQVLT